MAGKSYGKKNKTKNHIARELQGDIGLPGNPKGVW